MFLFLWMIVCALLLQPSAGMWWMSGNNDNRDDNTHTKKSNVIACGVDKKFLAQHSLPADVSKHDILQFLSQPEGRDIFMRALDIAEVEELPVTDELEDLWKQGYDYFDENYDDDEADNVPTSPTTNKSNRVAESILIASTEYEEMPGMKASWTPVTGCKTLVDADSGDFIAHDIMLVAEKVFVEGLTPWAWLVRSIFGISKKNNAHYTLPSIARTRTVITLEEHDNQEEEEENRRLILAFDVTIKISVTIPFMFWKLLPASKEDLEKEGNESLLEDSQFLVDEVSTKFSQALLEKKRKTTTTTTIVKSTSNVSRVSNIENSYEYPDDSAESSSPATSISQFDDLTFPFTETCSMEEVSFS